MCINWASHLYAGSLGMRIALDMSFIYELFQSSSIHDDLVFVSSLAAIAIFNHRWPYVTSCNVVA